MGFWGGVKKLGGYALRGAAAIGTGGLSEAIPGLGKMIPGLGGLGGAENLLGTKPYKPNSMGNIDPSVGQIDPTGKLAMDMQAKSMNQQAYAQMDRGQADQARAQQGQLADMLMQQAQGQGPSIAQAQLQAASDQNMRQAMALGASGRGPGAMAQMKAIGDQRSQIGAQQSQDSAMLRLQEQLGARQMLGQHLGGMRGQDQQMYGMDLGAQQGYDQQRYGMGQQQAENDLNRAKIDREYDATLQGHIAKGYQVAEANKMGLINSLGSMAVMKSDVNLKEDIKSADKDLYEFLDTLNAHDYKYKDEKHGKGRHTSVMAQELQKSKLGKDMVEAEPDGLAVNYGKGLGKMLAASAALHKRVKKLEGEEE